MKQVSGNVKCVDGLVNLRKREFHLSQFEDYNPGDSFSERSEDYSAC